MMIIITIIIIIIIVCLKIAANGHGLCSVWVRTSRSLRCSDEYQSLNGYIHLHFALASSGAQLCLVLTWQWTGCLTATSNIEFYVRVKKCRLKRRTFISARRPQNITREAFPKQRQCGMLHPALSYKSELNTDARCHGPVVIVTVVFRMKSRCWTSRGGSEISDIFIGLTLMYWFILDFRLSPCTEYSKLSLG